MGILFGILYSLLTKIYLYSNKEERNKIQVKKINSSWSLSKKCVKVGKAEIERLQLPEYILLLSNLKMGNSFLTLKRFQQVLSILLLKAWSTFIFTAMIRVPSVKGLR